MSKSHFAIPSTDKVVYVLHNYREMVSTRVGASWVRQRMWPQRTIAAYNNKLIKQCSQWKESCPLVHKMLSGAMSLSLYVELYEYYMSY